jgi:hypothetical protein
MQYEKVYKALSMGQFSLNDVGIKGLGGKNIYLDLESKSFDSVTVHFDAGLVLVPQNNSFQTLMLIQEQAVVFAPKELIRVYLMGYCINPSKAGPRKQASYRELEMASRELRGLAKLMNKFPVQQSQGIIWDFVNHKNFDQVRPYHKEGEEETWNQFLMTARPNCTFQIEKINSMYNPYSYLIPEMEVEATEREVASIASQVLFMNDEDIDLSLRVIDEEGEIVRQYFENQTYSPGAHSIIVGFSDFYPKETVFKIQLIDNAGAIFQEMEVTEETPFEEKEIYEVRFNYKFTVRESLENMKILLKTEQGELVSQLKDYDKLSVAYHNVKITFNHYYDPNQSFLLELVDDQGKVYDRTQFIAMRAGKKLYSEW